ncbi:MAG: DUF4230 domain-containing protein [Microthrixaceae bacterium]
MGRLVNRRSKLPMVATVSLGIIAVALLGLLVFGIIGALDPFGSETVDRSGPALLQRIRTLEEFTAAEASFTQDVDLQDDANLLPDFIQGERVTALVTGSVRATVDFSQLDDDAVQVSDDRTTIRIRLPQPTLSDPEIDETSTRIVARQRGLLNRIEDAFSSNPFDDAEVYQAAQDKLDDAAADSDVLQQARDNTERWLTTFLQAAGFTNVEVSWTEEPR